MSFRSLAGPRTLITKSSLFVRYKLWEWSHRKHDILKRPLLPSFPFYARDASENTMATDRRGRRISTMKRMVRDPLGFPDTTMRSAASQSTPLPIITQSHLYLHRHSRYDPFVRSDAETSPHRARNRTEELASPWSCPLLDSRYLCKWCKWAIP